MRTASTPRGEVIMRRRMVDGGNEQTEKRLPDAPRPSGWHQNRGTATERGYGSRWRKLRNAAMRRDNWLCQPCQRKGKITAATECDHVVPKAQGGTDDPENLQAICRACHRRKTQAEAAQAQGRRVRPQIGADGWPEEG